MESFCGSSLRVVLVLTSILLILQTPRILASGSLRNSKACGTYHISYLGDPNQELYYLNGKLVEKYNFCKALETYRAKHCFLTRNLRNQNCRLGFLIDKVPSEPGRKLLRNTVREGSAENDFDKKTILNSKGLYMAVPIFFIICCAVLCPCFRARKKETQNAVLDKETNPMDSILSVQMDSVSEKIPGSPLRVPPSPLRFSMSPKLNEVGSVHLSMNQISRATHNFSPSRKVGEGGFGTVYRAELPDGQVVAVKRARKELFETLRTEFRSEIELLAKIEHRSLVKLLGYINKGNEHLIITEYVPNGTLREHLDGEKGKILDFNQRLEISIDVAHGLTYLHLYTERMRAKVADFGFAKLGEMDSGKSHVSTKVKGTVGYLDPEYMKTNQLTAKSDVYSFGILLLEILTGRRPVELMRTPDEKVTLRWAFRKYNDGKLMEMLDPLMKEDVEHEILVKMFGLAIDCAAPTRASRPDMKSVGEQLWGIRMEHLRSGRREQ
ncbi:unnamed protein product [Fraxinus pennsylvanica]|uniref:Protein kinase domain-containing protein n=1 Tax=Fraxinus pennsylvanica TaxID=56036 RepID=A0AAD1ZAD1_9LAMI|nr:unnamed protein product [Fraxinus pennsylvanica]